jgi:hypothetical protein
MLYGKLEIRMVCCSCCSLRNSNVSTGWRGVVQIKYPRLGVLRHTADNVSPSRGVFVMCKGTNIDSWYVVANKTSYIRTVLLG